MNGRIEGVENKGKRRSLTLTGQNMGSAYKEVEKLSMKRTI
jgi:hypothetical protein